jgi:hypothetical protein
MSNEGFFFFVSRLPWSHCLATVGTEIVTAQTLSHIKPDSIVSKAEEQFLQYSARGMYLLSRGVSYQQQ